MKKEEFEKLREEFSSSGLSLRRFLLERGISPSSYRYWRRKCAEEPSFPLSPIRLRPVQDPFPSPDSVLPCGTTLFFPNGLRAHFGSGTEKLLLDLLEKSLSCHVLP